MRARGWRGASRARRTPRTTEPDPAARRPPDLVGRRWRVAAPNRLLVADFTYVPMAAGFGIHRVCDRRLRRDDHWLGMLAAQGHPLRRTRAAPRRGFPRPARAAHFMVGSITRMPDRNIPQYISPRTVMLAGLKPSIGSVGDASTTGWPKPRSGCTNRVPPCRLAVSDRPDPHSGRPGRNHSTWVCWYNESGSCHRLGRRPPTEAEANYYARVHVSNRTPAPVGVGLAHRIGTSAPVSRPSPGKITEPVFRDAGTSLRPGRGGSVSACHLRFGLRAAAGAGAPCGASVWVVQRCPPLWVAAFMG